MGYLAVGEFPVSVFGTRAPEGGINPAGNWVLGVTCEPLLKEPLSASSRFFGSGWGVRSVSLILPLYPDG